MNDTTINIRNYEFESAPVLPMIENKAVSLLYDPTIQENHRFSYPVFIPKNCLKSGACILMLHGLNERHWDKYLCWAEYLAVHTGKPVVLFPIAYHINRSPSIWSDPRKMRDLVDKRKAENGNARSLSFVNAALSERISEDPSRFYNAGRQTVADITKLMHQIKAGEHPLFESNASVDIFAYSIGSFLAEILLMANPDHLFDSSKLFVFCGGSIFRGMAGESRCIMDKPAYDKLFSYYCDEWLGRVRRWISSGRLIEDNLLDAFNAMILPEEYREKREAFFLSQKNRIAGISLVQDNVMPYSGVEACMGSQLAGERFQVMDFPYKYTHEMPFPTDGHVDETVLNESFLSVFRHAAAFLL
ncbi:MAG: DUF6051 family protein [Bacteroidota bacterium]|nr:DUF6051 family protein [Bacteroidota bacterium]